MSAPATCTCPPSGSWHQSECPANTYTHPEGEDGALLTPPNRDYLLCFGAVFVLCAFVGAAGLSVAGGGLTGGQIMATFLILGGAYGLGSCVTGYYLCGVTNRALAECRDFARVSKLALAARDAALATGATEGKDA